jgi:hypothetical protein
MGRPVRRAAQPFKGAHVIVPKDAEVIRRIYGDNAAGNSSLQIAVNFPCIDAAG